MSKQSEYIVALSDPAARDAGRFGPKAAWKELKRQLPGWVEKAPQIPNLMHGALTRLNHLDENQQKMQEDIFGIMFLNQVLNYIFFQNI